MGYPPIEIEIFYLKRRDLHDLAHYAQEFLVESQNLESVNLDFYHPDQLAEWSQGSEAEMEAKVPTPVPMVKRLAYLGRLYKDYILQERTTAFNRIYDPNYADEQAENMGYCQELDFHMKQEITPLLSRIDEVLKTQPISISTEVFLAQTSPNKNLSSPSME